MKTNVRRALWTAELAAIGVALAAAAPSEARAGDRDNYLDTRRHTAESPQHFALELRFSPYRPDVDDDPALHGAKPFGSTFGRPQNHVLFSVELDWQALKIAHVGTLGPGVGIGYSAMSGTAPLHSDPTKLSAEQTTLEVYPFHAVVVFRADAISKDLRIPLVPYAKAGIAYALWRASNELGTSTAPVDANDPTKGTVDGKGHTWGSMLAAGVGFDLNALDQKTARALDNDTGINHTYLFAEYMLLNLNGIGQSNVLRLGDNTWTAGLAFEF